MVSPKARDLSWRLSHDILPNFSKLFSLSCSDTSKCVFCEQVETIDHLFVYCEPVHKLWTKFEELCMNIFTTGKGFTVGPEEILLNLSPKNSEIVLNKSIFIAMITEMKLIIWKSRCLVHFENQSFTSGKMWQIYILKLREKCFLDFQRFKTKEFNNIWGKVGKFCEVKSDQLQIFL